MARDESSFKEKIEKLPVIGRQHESGVTFGNLVKDVDDYVTIEFKDGEDLNMWIASKKSQI